MLLNKSPEQAKELVKKLLERKKQDLRLWHKLIDTRWDRYFLEHYPGEAVPGEERVYLSHEMRQVNIARALLMRELPKIHAYSQMGTSTAQKDSDKVEAWLRGLVYMQKRTQRVDPVSLFTLDMLATGMGVLQSYWDTSIRPPDVPIVFRNRDPRCIFPQEGGTTGRWRWVIAAEEVPILDIEEEWAEELEGRGLEEARRKKYDQKLHEQIQVIDVWSREVDAKTGEPVIANMVLTSKTILKQPAVMERYKDLPFEIAFCIPTTAKDWTRKGLPITSEIEMIVPELENLLSSELRRAKISAQLPWFSKGFGSRPPELPEGFGTGIHYDSDQDIGFIQLPGPPPDLMVMVRKLEENAEAGGFGAPVGGTPPASPSGYALSLRSEAGTLRLVEPSNSLQNALVNVFQNACSLAAAYAPNEAMVVLGRLKDQSTDSLIALTGKECEGFLIDVEVEAGFPLDKMRDRAIGMQLALAPKPILDMRTILEEYMHHENVDEIKRRILVEMAEQHPEMMRYLMLLALQEAGMEDALAQMTGQQAGQPSIAQPGVSVPVPGVPTQVSPQEGLGAMRSQEVGTGPEGHLFPEEELLGFPFPTV